MGKLIVICHSGGKFSSKGDATLVYAGGDAHAMSVRRETKFEELKSEISEMCNVGANDGFTIKYFLPNNRRTLITISSDKDVERMLDFHEDSGTVEFYVMTEENLPVVEASPPTTTPTTIAVTTTTTTTTRSRGKSRGRNTATPESSTGNRTRSGKRREAEPVTPIDVTPLDAVAEDATPQANQMPSGSTEISSAGQLKLLKLWGDAITGLHQQFNNVQELRDALRKFSIAHGFKFVFKRNDLARVSAKCKGEGCPWRVYASRLSNTQLFRIKRYNEMHTCGAGTGTAKCNQASRKLVASIVKEGLINVPNFKPKEIADQIRQEFGIELRYSQAWRGMEIAREELQGSYEEAYNQLPWLCRKMGETNPGTLAILNTREDLSFHRIFVAFHASIFGFENGCRPLLFLDTVYLNSKYQSELLTATALDGNDNIFPVAFALVDVENEDNWHWFLVQLKCALANTQQLTFVADRQMGLRQSIPLVFENSSHGYCLRQLSDDLRQDLKGPYTEEVVSAIIGHFYDAAHASILDGFRKSMDTIRSISPEAYDWILQSEPEHWANYLFEGSRYNNMDSNIGESFYAWVTEIPTLPIVQIIDTIRQKLMELIYHRKVESGKWLTRLTPLVEDKLQKEVLKAQSVQAALSPSTAATFEVTDWLGVVYFVTIDAYHCTCGEWQFNGYPCCHAVAALQLAERDIRDYCARYYTIEAFRMTYLQPIKPVPTTDKPVRSESTPAEVYPPPLRHESGPSSPKRRRIRNRVIKRQLHCSKCKGAGHNRATCQADPVHAGSLQAVPMDQQ